MQMDSPAAVLSLLGTVSSQQAGQVAVLQAQIGDCSHLIYPQSH